MGTAGLSTEGQRSDEYFINVTSIAVNNKPIPINATLLAINENGVVGTKISTVDPYNVMETTLYNTVVSAFFRERNLTTVPPVAPFGACFD